jgi:Pyruvate/2-oxoacid:ferredoxin oxidoreductase gamma subunit
MAKESGSEIMANTAALAVAAGVTGYPLQYMEGVIRDNFKKKGLGFKVCWWVD